MSATLARTCAFGLICSLTVSAAMAALVGAVVAACDQTHDARQAGNYGIKGDSLVGCTNDVVFECPPTRAAVTLTRKHEWEMQ
jgi:type IV secretory pathway protease TraF